MKPKKKPGRPKKEEAKRKLSQKDKLALRKKLKAEMADKHPNKATQLTDWVLFKLDTGMLWFLDKIKTIMFNQTRSHIENNILIQCPEYPQVVEMRRLENVEPKRMEKTTEQEKENKRAKDEMRKRKTETANFIKKVIAKLLKMKEDEALAHIHNLAEEEAQRHVAYRAMDLATQAQIKRCEEYMEAHLPIWGTKDNPGWLQSQKGIGVKLGAKLICIVKEYDRFVRPSSLWAYMGVGDASAEKREHGRQLHHNPKGRSLLFVIAGSFMRQHSEPWESIYHARYAHTLITHPEWHGIRAEGEKNMNPGHADKDARRIMMKAFLLEFLVEYWRSYGKELPSKKFQKTAAA